MTVLKYDLTFIRYFNFFKTITGLDAKDCFALNDTIVFVAEKEKAGLAIGKGGRNIIALKNGLKKSVKIIEAADSPEEFVEHFVFPLKPISVTREGNKLSVKFASGRDRRVLLSNNLSNLRQLKESVRRYFPDIEDIIVLSNE